LCDFIDSKIKTYNKQSFVTWRSALPRLSQNPAAVPPRQWVVCFSSTSSGLPVPVTFGPHQALLRPREGHDLHIKSSLLTIEPRAEVRWLRDIYGNSIAILTFSESGRKLSLFSEVVGGAAGCL
jgi:hypothetical protein